MQHYFALDVNEKQIFLDEGDIFHVTKVMRMKKGEFLIAVFNEKFYLGEIISLSPLIISNKQELDEPSRELTVPTTLFISLAKGDKIDFIIQKATELGVSRIVLIKTRYSIVKMNEEDFNRKLHNRYLKIAKEASEQSERRKIPELLGVYDITNIPSHLLADVNLLAYEEKALEKIELSSLKSAKSVSLLVGPEGGLNIEEVKSLVNIGFKPISLGKRILRVETAVVAGLAMINMELEK